MEAGQWKVMQVLCVVCALALAASAVAQRAIQLASNRGMESPCGAIRSTDIPWPFGHGECDSHECWNDPNPVCICQRDQWGLLWCQKKVYVEGYACRWAPFGNKDCVNTILNGVCYYTYFYNASLEPCYGDPYTVAVTRRDFCARP